MLTFRERARHRLRASSLYTLVRRFREDAEIVRWIRTGRPVPAPGVVKRSVIRQYATRFDLRVLIETGTYLGDTVADLRENFDEVFSIELDDQLFRLAQRRFSGLPRVHVLHGDSSEVLPTILARLQTPALFWLDGHFSGGPTAKAALETPLFRELDAVASHGIKGHVVLIDDARCLGTGDYPSLEAVETLVRARQADWCVELAEDIVRLHAKIPPSPSD